MERRKFVRVNAVAGVRYRLKGQAAAQTRLVESRDISEGGVRLFLNERFAIGQEIMLTIHPHSAKEQHWPEIGGVVAWQNGDPDLQNGSGNTGSAGISFCTSDVRSGTRRWIEEMTAAPAHESITSQLQEDKGLLLPEIRDSEFDSFAKRAAAAINVEESQDKGSQIEAFFNRDVRQWHGELLVLFHEMANGTLESESVEKRLATLNNDLFLKGYVLEKIVDKMGMKKIKQLFREITGSWWYQSPIVKMAYERPRGYPGDYELFEIVYNGKPLAKENTIGFYFDKYFLNNTYSQAVRTRKNKMKNILQDLVENSDSRRLRLLNVACGPCREIRELLSDPYLTSRAQLCFTGLDNDEGALKHSKSALDNLPSNIALRFLNENVLDLSRDSKYHDLIGKQDVIYLLGLTEYLPERIFKKLMYFLSTLLNDKGLLVITYKDKEIPLPSLPPDWVCDWAFIKRSKDDLINAAKGLGDKYSLRIEREGSGTIFFLILSKI